MTAWRVHLRLGRASNLPTVWTNVLAGAGLSGATLNAGALGRVTLALSFFYVGGMYLNDAFDRQIDARERPERPIPAGLISASQVFAVGFGFLALGLGLVAWSFELGALLAASALAAAIVLYDIWHKNNSLSPLLMGVCRMLVYWVSALSMKGQLTAPVLLGSFALLAYLIGLSYVAKQETLREFRNFWPLVFLLAPIGFWAGPSLGQILGGLALLGWSGVALYGLRSRKPGAIPAAVSWLIAGISWVDALALSGSSPLLALLCVLGVPLTLYFQRYIAGT